MLLQEFSSHSLQVMVALLETCGRYLYLTPETNERCVRFLDSMLRLKSAKASDASSQRVCFFPILSVLARESFGQRCMVCSQAHDAFTKDMMDNAQYAIKPPERAVVRQVRARFV